MKTASALWILWILMLATIPELGSSLSQDMPPPVKILQPIAVDVQN